MKEYWRLLVLKKKEAELGASQSNEEFIQKKKNVEGIKGVIEDLEKKTSELKENLSLMNIEKEEASLLLENEGTEISSLAEEKEKLIQENEKIESEIESLSIEEKRCLSNIESLNLDIQEKEKKVEEIKDQAHKCFEKEEVKYKKDLLIEKEKNEALIKGMLSESEEKARSIETKASDLLKEVSEKEVSIYELKSLSEKESTEHKEKLAEEILQRRHELNQEAQDSQKRALLEYEKVLLTAKDKAVVIVESAKEKASEFLGKSKEEARELFLSGKEELEKAQEKATQIIRLAQDKSSEIHMNGLKELEQIKTKLGDENTELSEKINKQVQLKSKLREELALVKSTFDGQKLKLDEYLEQEEERILADAHAKASEIKEIANDDLANAKKQAQSLQDFKLKETKSLIESKEAQEREKLEIELTQEREALGRLRAQELSSIQTKKNQFEKDFQERKKNYTQALSTGVVNVVRTKLNELVGKKISKTDIQLETDQLKYLVKACLLDENPEENQLLKKLNPYGRVGTSKSIKLMKRTGYVLGVLVLIFSFPYVAPETYKSLASSFNGLFSVDKSAKEIYLQNLKEKESSRPRFTPKKTDAFKKNMTDNVLYTNSFEEIWMTDKFQKKWTLNVDEIVVFKLKLDDSRVVSYIAAEFKIIRKLIDMKKKIKLKTEKKQIEEMREFEKDEKKKLVKILNTKKNLRELELLRRKIFLESRNFLQRKN